MNILNNGNGSAILPLAQLTALEHPLNILGILHHPVLRHLLYELLAQSLAQPTLTPAPGKPVVWQHTDQVRR